MERITYAFILSKLCKIEQHGFLSCMAQKRAYELVEDYGKRVPKKHSYISYRSYWVLPPLQALGKFVDWAFSPKSAIGDRHFDIW